MKIIKKAPIIATNLRIWVETRNKLKAIAKHYHITMTVLLDQVADNLIIANNIPYGETKNKENQ